MNREIKFRAWIKHPNGDMNAKGAMGYDAQRWAGFDAACNSDDFVIMQYVGLLDKNGKEIYEGDIVKFESGIGQQRKFVSYKDATFWLYSQMYIDGVPIEYCSSNISIGEPMVGGRNYETIGNIYENPNILNEEK